MQVELVERARHGDQDAFASLCRRSIDRCYALAYRILRDPHRAQDATQQALLGAWRDLPDAAGPRAVRSLASPPRRQRLLRRGPRRTPPLEARVRLSQTRPTDFTRRGALRRRARRARARLPPAVSGTAGGRRPPSPPRVPADGDRGDPGHPRWDRAVPPSLRGPSAAGRARRRQRVLVDFSGATRMNRSTESDFDQRIADWLENDPGRAPAQAAETVLAAFPSIPQRRAIRVPWRFPNDDARSPRRGRRDRRARAGRRPSSRRRRFKTVVVHHRNTVASGAQIPAPASASGSDDANSPSTTKRVPRVATGEMTQGNDALRTVAGPSVRWRRQDRR